MSASGFLDWLHERGWLICQAENDGSVWFGRGEDLLAEYLATTDKEQRS